MSGHRVEEKKLERRNIRIIVYGKNEDYYAYTIFQWLLEVKELLENEYGISIEAIRENVDFDVPILEVEGKLAFAGFPGEEGYLIEHVKKVLEEVLDKDRDCHA